MRQSNWLAIFLLAVRVKYRNVPRPFLLKRRGGNARLVACQAHHSKILTNFMVLFVQRRIHIYRNDREKDG